MKAKKELKELCRQLDVYCEKFSKKEAKAILRKFKSKLSVRSGVFTSARAAQASYYAADTVGAREAGPYHNKDDYFLAYHRGLDQEITRQKKDLLIIIYWETKDYT